MPINYDQNIRTRGIVDRKDSSKFEAEYTNENEEPDDIIRRLQREKGESLKREETARDKLKLQETLYLKQIQDLRAQVKKLTTENLRLQKIKEKETIVSTVRTERKKDGKSKEVRELNKAVEAMKNENKGLLDRVIKLSDFIQVASELKNSAIQQCINKDNHIREVESQKRFIEQNRDRERTRRIQAESEIHSLRSYIDYREHKYRENARNKCIQTNLSLPIQLKISSVGPGVSNSYPSPRASFSSLIATSNAQKLKKLELDYKNETMNLKQKFNDVATGNPAITGKDEHDEKTNKTFKVHFSDDFRDIQTNLQNLVSYNISFDDHPSSSNCTLERRCTSQQGNYVGLTKSVPPPPRPVNGKSSSVPYHKSKIQAPAINMAAVVYNNSRY